MRDRSGHASVGDTDTSGGRLPGFGEALSRITAHFTLEGAIGILVIDASRLAVIERQYGGEAHRRAMDDLGTLVHELIGERLSINDLVVRGETGRNEILVLVFRPYGLLGAAGRSQPLQNFIQLFELFLIGMVLCVSSPFGIHLRAIGRELQLITGQRLFN